jgi:hypothetical protein
MGFLPNDYPIKKRRYSAFFGTDFEILLRGLKIDTQWNIFKQEHVALLEASSRQWRTSIQIDPVPHNSSSFIG